MNKLKNLSQEDLNQISDFISSTAQNYILQQVSGKEITDLDIQVELSYKEELEVDVTVDLLMDDLSIDRPEIATEAIDYALDQLEILLDENYRT
ncbi:MAG: DUF3194 domain-containing protein [Methanobacteriaceae archaeon]|nr:DUF3194 domain-containing protein [Methanobacteriaceae archaeon]